MDKLDAVALGNAPNNRQQQGIDPVATLVSSLLDDVTVAKSSSLIKPPTPIANAANSDLSIVNRIANGSTPLAHAPMANGQIDSPLTVSDTGTTSLAANGYQRRPVSDQYELAPLIEKIDNPLPIPEDKPENKPEFPMAINQPTIATTTVLSSPISTLATSDVSFLPVYEQPASLSPFTLSSDDAQPSQPADDAVYQSDGMAINIKGRADGVIVEIGRGNWDILVAALRQRLAQAGGFFRGGNVALDLADRSLQESELRVICDVLVSHSMKPSFVRTSSDRTFQAALMLGLAGTLESKDGRPLETVQAGASNQEAQTHYVYRGALRSGQVLKRRSHVLIVGDVNPGSEVIATGDILIWGRLRGSAHAGADGDTRAVVAAFDIDPVQLRIADCIAVGSSGQSEGYRWVWSRNTEKRPEVARMVNGQIVIEPWDEAKSGGSPVLKKRR